MDMISETNALCLCGTAADSPFASHSIRGAEFWQFPLSVLRLSGTADRINVVARRELLEPLALRGGERLLVQGELRSFNNRRGEGAKLVITAYARTLLRTDAAEENRISLFGTLCKPPTLRQTPLGRDICDLMLAVNRRCGRSDYLPCICWGALARRAADWQVGDRLRLEGRVQSRRYLKVTEQGPVERTAYEVSVLSASRVQPPVAGQAPHLEKAGL